MLSFSGRWFFFPGFKLWSTIKTMSAIKFNTQMAACSSTIIRAPSRSNLHLQKTAVLKIDLVLFEWREHALSCKSFFFFLPLFRLQNSSFLKQLKITRPMFPSSLRLQTLSLSLAPPPSLLLCAIFSCPQDPPCSCLSLSLLFPLPLPFCLALPQP